MNNFGRYQILSELGRGGTGVVLRAMDPVGGREVALKLLNVERTTSPAARQRFQREAEALARLEHPHIVSLLESGEHQQRPYLVLELVQGTSLDQLLRLQGVLSVPEAASVTRKLALALAHAHERNVLHRDVKPENVLIDVRGEPHLTDFGLTRDLDPELSGTRLSRSGRFLGTPGYWAPEQAFGKLDQIGPHTDVYGLGATLYTQLTGRPPFAFSSLSEALTSLREPPQPPSKHRPGLDPGLEQICLRCLAFDPADRYPSAAALAEALTRFRPQAPRRPLPLLPITLGLVALVALVVAGGLLLLDWERPAETPTTPATPDTPTNGDAQQEPLPAEDPDVLWKETLTLLGSDPKQAQANIKRALEIDPTHLPSLNLAGTLCWGAKRYDRAIHYFERVLEIKPNHEEALNGLGLTYEATGRREEALRAFDRAVAANPDYASTYHNRGVSRAKANDLSGALADLDHSIQLGPSAQVLKVRGFTHGKAGNLTAAEADYTWALELKPGDMDTHRRRGMNRIPLRDFRGAAEDFDAVLAVDPDNLDALANRTLVRIQLGDTPGAHEDCKRVLELLPPNDSRLPRMRQLLEETR